MVKGGGGGGVREVSVPKFVQELEVDIKIWSDIKGGGVSMH